MTERSKVRVYLPSLAGTATLNPARDIDACLLSGLCCQVEASATGRSLVQEQSYQLRFSFVSLYTCLG